MLLIGISGGSGSGKTTFAKNLKDKLPNGDIDVIPLDRYYKDRSDIPLEKRREINFDHPDAIDFALLIQHIKDLKANKNIDMPEYSFINCTRTGKTLKVTPKKILILEGILAYSIEEIRNLTDMKIYLDCESDLRLARIIRRDIKERGRAYDEVLTKYESSIKPMHNKYVEPSRKYADLIIPNGVSNDIALNFTVSMINNQLLKKK